MVPGKATEPFTLSLSDVSDDTSAPGEMEKIPRVIHQLWKDENIPERWSNTVNSCRRQHPDENGWQFILWTDEKIMSFMNENYSWFMPVFHSYPYNIQKFDAARYFILYHYGGVYMDLDIGCKKPMDPLLSKATFILPSTEPIGYSNDWFAATPKHPFLYQAIHNLSKFNHRYFTKYPTVFLSAGPLFLSYQFCKYLLTPHEPVRVLPALLYGNEPNSFFSHVTGDSWHGTDAKVFIWIDRNSKSVLFFAFLAAFAILFLCLRVVFKRRRKRGIAASHSQIQELYP